MEKQNYSYILIDWDYTKNDNVDPFLLSKTNTKKIWWKCSMGHEYRVSFYSRVRSNGCKICNSLQKGEKIRKAKLKTGKSFAESKPTLLSEWDYVKNNIKPDEISEKSHIKIWFMCEYNHSYQTSPQNRLRGRGCIECYKINRGRIVRESKLKINGSSLAQEHPQLIKQWDFQKNILKPTEFSSGSNQSVFWKCDFGHSWKAVIYNRTGNGSGCPFCHSSTSKLEIFILCELKALFDKVKWRSKIEGYECDVLLPDQAVGIEIDGAYWHNEKIERDSIKYKVFSEKGIHLIRVRDSSLPTISGSVVLFDKKTKYIDLVISVLKIIQQINPSLNFDNYIRDEVQVGLKEYKKILSFLPAPAEGASLLFLNPDLSKEWNFDKNLPLTPAMFAANSEKKVFWNCKMGHSWEASIKNRHNLESGCLICYRENIGDIVRKSRLAAKGVSFAKENPELLNEWDYSLNIFDPSKISSGSGVKAYWKCHFGHTWQAIVSARARRSVGCPECSNETRSERATKVRINKTGTLAEKNPKLIEEWDYEVNKNLPSQYPPRSSKRVGWVCKNGHKWEATIKSRSKGEGACPFCQSLAIKNLELLNEWDFKKNKETDPNKIHSGSKEKVWWICKKCGKSWYAAIANRTGKDLSGCPQCGIKKSTDTYKKTILKIRGSVKEKYPILMKYWDKEKNDKQGYSSDLMTCGSRIKIFWHCPNCNHKWQSSVNDRTNSKYTCPKCKFEKIAKG